MSTKKLIKALGLIIVVALLAAVLPMQAKAQDEPPQTLNVAQWTGPTNTGITGRETVLKVGGTYHIWYSPSDTTIYHTSSTDPDSFTEATSACTFNGGTPAEVGSVSVVEESGTFYMIAYGATNKVFAIYTSSDGNTWAYGGVIFDGTNLPAYNKIDGPFLFKDVSTYRLYFQVKNADGTRYDIYTAESTAVSLAEIAATGDSVDFTLANSNLPVLSPSTSGWDSAMVMHPWVVKDGSVYYMWYSAHQGEVAKLFIGMAKSTDGLHWVKSPANPILPVSGTAAEPSVIKDNDGTWHMWHFSGAVYHLTATGPFEFQSIQDAIDAASAGDTVNVAAGTYVEDITATKAINFIGEVDELGEPLPLIEGTLEINLSSAPTFDWSIENLTFQVTDNDSLLLKNNITGLTVRNCVFDGDNKFIQGHNGIEMKWSNTELTVEDSVFINGLYVSIDGYAKNISVLDSEFTNVKSGVNIQSPGNNTVIVDNSTFSVIAQGATNDTYGVRFASSGANTGGNLTITNSSFVVNKNGFVAGSGTYHSAIIIRAGATGALKVENSSILGEVVNLTASNPLDASPNWWGSIAGPASGQILGTGPVTSVPWCGDAQCTFVVYPYTALGTDLQSAINTAPDGAGIYVPGPATYSQDGGFTIANDKIRIILGDGVKIENNSPCFTVSADHVRITAESTGGAKCVPTDRWPGINADNPINDFVLDGLEIDGTGQDTGAGVYLYGGGSDIQILNNYMHNLSADDVPSTAIDYYAPIYGVFDIQGNLFLGTAGITDLGNFETHAEYNSWGAFNVTEGMVNYAPDFGTIIYFEPWTHMALFLDSNGTPWEDQVVVGQQITYDVIAQMKKIAGADFALEYDPAKLELVNVTAVSGIFDPATEAGLVDSSVPGVIRYAGYKYPAVSSIDETGTVLYTVTFKAKAAGTTNLHFDADSDQFAMIPPSGPSTNVYAASMESVTLNEIVLPTIDSTNIQGYYLSGEERQFSVVLANPNDGGDFEHVYVDFTIQSAEEGKTASISQIESLSYSVDGGTTWVQFGAVGTGTYYEDSGGKIVGYFGKITGGGFPIEPGDTQTTLFNVIFTTRDQVDTDYPTSYSITMSLKDADTADPDTQLAAFTKTANVYDKPTLGSTDIQGYYLVGDQQDFSVQVVNPATGGNFGNTIYYNFQIANAALTDIASLSCDGYPVTLIQDGDNLTGSTGPFPMPNDEDWNTTCLVKFNTAKDYVFTVSMEDRATSQYRTLQTYSNTAVVYTKPVISSTDITGPYQQGVAKNFTVNVNNVDSMYDPNSFTLHFNFPSGTTGVYNGTPFACDATGCDVTVTLIEGDNPLTFTVTFNAAWNAPATVTLIDGQFDPDRTLATFTSGNVVVYANIAQVQGTVSMQGRTYRGGVLFTLTGPDGFTFGPYYATSIDQLGKNVVFANLASETYTITVTQPRYLDVIANLGAKINIGSLQTIAALELRAGDANDDNTIDPGDAGIVGGQYKQPSPTNGDINFDGTVNIQDLALVGSNYGFTSATAYVGWMGITNP